MCGICGELKLDGSMASPGPVHRMMDVMESRGPNGAGLFCQGPVALGHRRLSIIDLSERAQQPAVDSHLGLSIVYNGAIYNYRELREELEADDYRFFSHSDTEVIIKAYHAWGPECVHRLNGMFAFAIWHRDSNKLFLARDRLGIKPLYYTSDSSTFHFASSLPALIAADGVDTEIDPVALHHYMTFHSVVPAPRTILRSIKKLPPGTTMTIDASGKQQIDTYWQLEFASDSGASTDINDWKDALLEKLNAAVKRRIVADVPVGILLSGGLDSSLVVGLLAAAHSIPLRTFSIGFETVGDESGNEFQYSDVIAERFHTQHHRIEIDSAETLQNLEPCVNAMSEPMVSHDCIGFYLLSREVAKHVTVVESGQGADEIFGGYHWYPPMLEGSDPFNDYRKVFFDRDHDEYREAVNPRFHGEDYSSEFVERAFATARAARGVDKALHLDTSVMLVDDPVKRVDNMTMAWGLEARVPFLDHELVEFAATIPAELKVGGGGKYVLKEAAREVIPEAVIDRPKGYFPVPALKHIRGEVLEFVKNVLNEPAARKRQLFNSAYIDGLMSSPEANLTPLRGSKLWQAALLEYWLQVHGI